MMKVLVTGASGQLGREVVELFLGLGYETYGYARDELDITDEENVRRVLHELMPDVVIHAAAYTHVDRAEDERVEAFRINIVGTRNIVVAAEQIGAKICYISTDYVFDGNRTRPYMEYDQVNPLSMYGKTKYGGEVIVQSLSSKYFIVRTSWLYGTYGNNFVKTMLRLAQERPEIKVVDDQVGSPTYVGDLVTFLSELIVTEKYGTYHASNTGSCSWYQFAETIFAKAGITLNLIPIPTSQYPTRAIRPAYSVLDHLAIQANGFRDLPRWQDGLDRFMVKLEKMHNEK